MFNIFLRFLVLLSLLGIMIFPSDIIDCGKNAVELAFFRVIPSLFPFFTLQSLIVLTGISNTLSNTLGVVFKKIFKISNSSAYILGIIGGYPLGFKGVVGLYKEKIITKSEAEHMAGFCNNAGPAFIIGFISIYLFQSEKIGYLLLSSHVLSSFIVGVIFSFFAKKSTNIQKPPPIQTPFYEAFIKSVNDGFSSVLTVCGYVIFFSVFTQILANFKVFSTISLLLSPIISLVNLSSDDFTAILIGTIELTSGINYLQSINSSVLTKILISSFLLAFCGISIHFQTLNFKENLNLKKYYIAKLLQCIISPILSFFMYNHYILKFSPVFFETTSIQTQHTYQNFTFCIFLLSIILIFSSSKLQR